MWQTYRDFIYARQDNLSILQAAIYALKQFSK